MARWMRRLKLYKAQLVSLDSIKDEMNGGLLKNSQLQSAREPANFYRFLPAAREILTDGSLNAPSQAL